MIRGRLNFVVGGQYGSEGKGKIAAYLALLENVDYAICSFSSQAGHTYQGDNGDKYVVQQVPMSVVNKKTKLLISQGAIIDPDVLRREIDEHNLNEDRLKIHPKAMTIEQRHKDLEESQKSGPRRIASTCKGNGAAMADFVLRTDKVKLIEDLPEFRHLLADTRQIINDALYDGTKMCMAEGAQGYSLDIYQGMYPFVTSRSCSPVAELARIGVNPWVLGDVYGVYRTYPIRVGNIPGVGSEIIGYSGGWFSDQHELDWDKITELAKSSTPLLERTTVTQRVRRVFSFSYQQFRESINNMGITHVCLCFLDYINAVDMGVTNIDKLSSDSKEYLDKLRSEMNQVRYKMPNLSLISTGPINSQMIDLRPIHKVG